MEALGIDRKNVEKMIGTRARVSEILNRKRPLTISMIRRISEKMHISADVLIQPYRLNIKSKINMLRGVMISLKIRKVGNSLVLILPREVINHLRVEDGDRLFLTEAPERSYRLTPYEPEFDIQMKLTEEGMARYRNTLYSLAK